MANFAIPFKAAPTVSTTKVPLPPGKKIAVCAGWVPGDYMLKIRSPYDSTQCIFIHLTKAEILALEKDLVVARGEAQRQTPNNGTRRIIS